MLDAFLFYSRRGFLLLVCVLLVGSLLIPARAQQRAVLALESRVAVQEATTSNLASQVERLERSIVQLAGTVAANNDRNWLQIVGISALLGDRAFTKFYRPRRKDDDDDGKPIPAAG